MLSLRLLMSAILIPLAVGLFALDATLGPAAPIFGAVIVVTGALMASEMVVMLRNRVPKLSRADVVIVVAAVIGVGWATHSLPFMLERGNVLVSAPTNHWGQALSGWLQGSQDGRWTSLRWYSSIVFAVGASGLVVMLWTIGNLVVAAIRIEHGSLAIGEVAAILSAKLFIAGYIGGTMLLTSQIRWISKDGFESMRVLAALLIATKIGDVGGYFAGRYLGKRRPLKVLSPNKTGAGFVGAIITGSAASSLWLYATEPVGLGFGSLAGYSIYLLPGLLMAMLGILGDLVESLIKRDAGVKDASQSLPGFGGVLDLLDSPLFTGATLVSVYAVAMSLFLLFN